MFNPATVDQSVIRFEADASGTYSVELYSEDTKAWSPVDSDQFCYNSINDTPEADT